MARAVFLDRDGVLNRPLIREGRPYAPRTMEEFELLPGVVEACRRLKAAKFLLVVVTNQPDVGRGKQERAVVETFHACLKERLPLDRIEVCYEDGDREPSAFKKPATGMLMRAARELEIDLSRSYMVGDRWRDIDCGHNAGCRTIFIDWGYREPLRQPPDFRAADLAEAAEMILRADSEDIRLSPRAQTS